MSEPEKQALEGSARTRRVQSGGGLRLTPGETRFGAALSLLPVLFSLPGVSSLALDWLVNVLPPDSIPPGPVPHVDRIDLEARGYLPPGYQKSLDNDRKGLAWERPTMAPPPDDIVPEQPRVSKAEEIEQRIAENGGDQQLASIGDLQKGAEGKDDEKGDNDKKKDNSGNTKPSQPAPTPPPPSENPKKSPETTTVKPPYRVDNPEVLQARQWVPLDNSDQSNSYGPPPTHRISSDNTSGEVGAHKPHRSLVQSGVSALINAGQKLEVIAQRFGTTVRDLLTVNPTLVVDGSGKVDSNAKVAIPGYGSPSQEVPEMSKAVKASVLEVVVLAQASPESAGLTRPEPNPGKHALQHTHEVERAKLAEEMRVVLPSGEEVANYAPGDAVTVKGFRADNAGNKLVIVEVGEGDDIHLVAVPEEAFLLSKGQEIKQPHLPVIMKGLDEGGIAGMTKNEDGQSDSNQGIIESRPTKQAEDIDTEQRLLVFNALGVSSQPTDRWVGSVLRIPQTELGEGVVVPILGTDGSETGKMLLKGGTLYEVQGWGVRSRETGGGKERFLIVKTIDPDTGDTVFVGVGELFLRDQSVVLSVGGGGEAATSPDFRDSGLVCEPNERGPLAPSDGGYFSVEIGDESAGCRRHFNVLMTGFSEGELANIEDIANDAVKAYEEIFGIGNVFVGGSSVIVFKGNAYGITESGHIILDDPAWFGWELGHKLRLPNIWFMGWQEGLIDFVMAAHQGQWRDETPFGVPLATYDQENKPELRSAYIAQNGTLNDRLYRLAGEAIYLLQEENPSFLPRLNIAYQEGVQEGRYEAGKPLTESQFMELVRSVWPAGGVEAVNRHHALFAKSDVVVEP